MKTFIIKKGGNPENPKTTLIRLNHEVDEKLLKSAINNVASTKGIGEEEVINYINDQFNGVEDIIDVDTINTFYY